MKFQVRTNIYMGVRKSWMVRWKDPDTGLWKARTAGKTKEEALLVQARVRECLFRGEIPLSQETKRLTTIGEAINRYFESLQFLSTCGTNQENAKLRLKALSDAFGSRVLFTLRRGEILKLYSHMKERGLSSATIRKAHFVYCSFGDFYREQHSNMVNPFREIRDLNKLFPLGNSTRDINFLTRDELEAIFLEIDDPFISNFIQFLAATGMRRGEAVSLKWKDIDRNSGFIQIRKTKNKRPRIIPLEKEAWSAIEGLQGNGEFVFVAQSGWIPEPRTFLKNLKRAAKRAGINKRVDLHTLRHSYGSNKVREGWGIRKVSQLMGHSDIKITAQVYSHLLDGDLKVRDEFLFGGSQKNLSQLIESLVSALKGSDSTNLDEKVRKILTQSTQS